MDLYSLPTSAVAGTIFLSKKLDPAKDIVVSFEYACYGTEVSGSEGFCVFFYDTYAKTLTGGGPGPGLCYTTTLGISATVNNTVDDVFYGVGYGQLGIGFDLTGNYGTSAFGLNGATDGRPNTITVRGSQTNQFQKYYTSNDLTASSYSKPLSLYQCITSIDDVKYYKMRIRLTDFCKTLIIDCQHPGDLEYTNYVNTSLPENWPVSVNSCLSFATGLKNTCFSVKNFNVNGIFTSLTAVPDVNLWTYYSACYLGQDPYPASLTVYDTISVVNAPPYNSYPPLINVTPTGTAPLQSSDDYVVVNYGVSSTYCLGDDYDLRLGGTLSDDAKRRLFNFIAEMVGWRMWGNLVDGWVLGSTFNKGTGRTAYALKDDTNNAYLLSSTTTSAFPMWTTNGIRFFDDPGVASNAFGTRMSVPNWFTTVQSPMSILVITKLNKTTTNGSCVFGQTSYGGPAGYHFGFNSDPGAGNFNVYSGVGSTINGSSYPGITLSGYYALYQIADKQNSVVRKRINNYTAPTNILLTNQALTGIAFGYDIRGNLNRPYDGEIAAAFVFKDVIDIDRFFRIYTNTIGQSLSLGFPSYP